MADINAKKVLITGSGGIIGSYFNFGQRVNKEDLDVTDEKSVFEAFALRKPEIVIHLAAETDVEKCEKDPVLAWRVNVLGAFIVAKACREFGAKMVYVSTAVVFSGRGSSHTEADIPFPLSVYGRTKYAAELAVQDIAPDYLIVRTSWVFGGGPARDHKFVGKIIGQLRGGVSAIKAVTDQVGSATFAKDFVERLKLFLEENRSGIVHVVNSGQATRYAMAREIVLSMGSGATVEPVSYEDFGLRADRASSEVLTSALPPLRPWQDALKEYLENEWLGVNPPL